jgi:ketosteroid isomerase-like protein
MIAVTIAALLVIAMSRTKTAAVTDPEASITALEHNFAEAVKAKNLDAMMANYSNSEDLVVFDVIPPLQYTGWNAYKEDWKKVLAGCAGAPTMDIRELRVYGDMRFAFSHSIQHFACKDPKGKMLEMTMRATDGYANFDGKWLIVHEHLSVPVDLATGRAELNATP